MERKQHSGNSASALSGSVPETKAKPATALPWVSVYCGDGWTYGIEDNQHGSAVAWATKTPEEGIPHAQDARYIVHAANQYPRLVAALHDALELAQDHADVRDGSDGRMLPNAAMSLAGELEALLRKLGELE